MRETLLLCLALLTAGCGFSSSSISIIGPAPPTLVSISVAPADSSLHVGATRQFMATGDFSDGSTQDLTASVTWSSATPTVATISTAAVSNGLVTAVGAGSTVITANSGTFSASTTLTVSSLTLVSIGVTPAAPRIAAGTTQPFIATGVFSDNSTQNLTSMVTWHTVNPAVASIGNAGGNPGLAMGLTPGSTAVTATLGGVTGSANLTVSAALVSIAVTPLDATVRRRATQQYVATGTFSDMTTQDITNLVTWTSSAPATAPISNAAGSHGLASGVAFGNTSITASLGAVNTAANPATLTVAAFAYALNFNTASAANASTVAQFVIGPAGQLAAIAPPEPPTVPTGPNPYSIAVDPSGQYAYVANYSRPNPTLGNITQYLIGADGGLTAMSTPTVATPPGPNGITVDPTGPYVYVANYDAGELSQYTIGAGGMLALTATLPVGLVGTNPASVTLDPTGKYAYVANFNAAGTVHQYLVGAGGALTPMSTAFVPAGNQPNEVVVDPSGRFVYAPNVGDGTVSQYQIGAGGLLSPLAPASVMTGIGPGTKPWSIIIDAAGHNAYVPNSSSDTVSQFTIDATTGALTLASTLSSPTLSVPTSVAIDPSGRFAYIANRGTGTTTVSQCTILPDGSLMLMNPATVTSGANPVTIISPP